MNKKLSFPIKIVVLILCFFLNNGYSLAGLEVSGVFRAEIISDPLNFNPSIPTTDPWQNQGGSLSSSFFNLDFTKIGLELKLVDNGVDVYWPFTLAVRAPSTATTPSFQAYLLADDYLNIPYHAVVNTDFFNYSLSNRPVGDNLSFIDVGDPLGIAKKLNSPQPILSFKMSGNKLPGNWGLDAYILFDQKTNALPSWERIPSGIGEAGSQSLSGGLVSEHGFIDERAGYNILRLTKHLNNQSQLGITFGQKKVSNPAFRREQNSDPQSLLYWGYVKENFGFDYAAGGTNSRWEAAIVGSRVQWRKYATTAVRIEKGAYVRQYYPFDVKGELTGNAGALKGEIIRGKRTYKFDAFAVEPNFQAVAAAHGQFPVVNLLEARTNTAPTLKRSVWAVFDPLGNLTATSGSSSPVVDFLGKRKLTLGFEEAGKLGSLPVLFSLKATDVSSLDKPEINYIHPQTGAKIIKDYQELGTQLIHRGEKGDYTLSFLDRKYLADPDYLRQAKGHYLREQNRYRFEASLDQTWRLRGDDLFGEGSSVRGYLAIGRELSPNSSLSVSLDNRWGTYDYGLLKPWDDAIVEPYTYRGVNVYFQQEQQFAFRGKRGSTLLAAELVGGKTDLHENLNGTATISYLNLELPWSGKVNSSHTLISANGPEEEWFPSNFLTSMLHQELNYQLAGDAKLRLAYTHWPKASEGNAFAEFVVTQGAGTFALGYGQATIPALASFQGTLAGSLSHDQAGYPAPKSLRGRPWEQYHRDAFYALRDGELCPTDKTWHNYLTLRYWYSF